MFDAPSAPTTGPRPLSRDVLCDGDGTMGATSLRSSWRGGTSASHTLAGRTKTTSAAVGATAGVDQQRKTCNKRCRRRPGSGGGCHRTQSRAGVETDSPPARSAATAGRSGAASSSRLPSDDGTEAATPERSRVGQEQPSATAATLGPSVVVTGTTQQGGVSSWQQPQPSSAVAGGRELGAWWEGPHGQRWATAPRSGATRAHTVASDRLIDAPILRARVHTSRRHSRPWYSREGEVPTP